MNEDVTSEICMPIKLDGEIVATVNVESNRLRPLTDGDFHLMLAIADQMSLLMRNALLHRNLKIERDQISWINQQLLALQAVGTAVLSRLDIQELLNFIAQSATELLGGQTGSIWLIAEDGTVAVHGFSLAARHRDQCGAVPIEPAIAPTSVGVRRAVRGG